MSRFSSLVSIGSSIIRDQISSIPALTSTVTVSSIAARQNTAITTTRPVTPAGGVTPYTYSISPSIPAGLSFNTSTGNISGTPSVYFALTTMTVTITDAANQTTSKTFTLSSSSYSSDIYTSVGTYTWVCPPDITSVSVLVVGPGGSGDSYGGGGGGGGCAYGNNIPVTPNTSYALRVGTPGSATLTSYFNTTTTLYATAGANGTSGTNYTGGGGGGAGGYAGVGGIGGSVTGGAYAGGAGGTTGGTNRTAGYNGGSGGRGGSSSTATVAAGAGTGGSAGGGSGAWVYTVGGGGVGLYGQGASGVAGPATVKEGTGVPVENGGSGGSRGEISGGGYYGGGAGGSGYGGGTPGSGAVRIVYGAGVTRTFPSTNVSTN